MSQSKPQRHSFDPSQLRKGGFSPGLEPEIERKLLVAVERCGGLANVDLAQLCKGNEKYFGEPKSERRRQVQNKINRWKNLTAKKFALRKQTILSSAFGVPSFEEEGESVSNERHHTPQPKKESPSEWKPLPSNFLGGLRRFAKQKSTKKMANNMPIHHSVTVDPTEPEGHREAIIVPFQDHPDNGILHNGFGIEVIGADFALYKDGYYRAWLLDSRRVLLQVPTARSSLLRHVGNYTRERTRIGGHSATYETARMVVVNRILARRERQTYNVEFVFPEGIELTNAVFSPGTAPHGRIEPQVTPVLIPVDVSSSMSHTLTGIEVDLCFAVTIVEEEPRVATMSLEQNADTNLLNDAMAGMHFPGASPGMGFQPNLNPIPRSAPFIPPPPKPDQVASGHARKPRAVDDADAEMDLVGNRGEKRSRATPKEVKKESPVPVKPGVSSLQLALAQAPVSGGGILMEGQPGVWDAGAYDGLSIDLSVATEDDATVHGAGWKTENDEMATDNNL